MFQYAELETILGDAERSRAIFELAINQTKLDMPEVLWKAYIDFEIEQEEYDRTRQLYRRLLQRTQHVKVRLPVIVGIDRDNHTVYQESDYKIAKFNSI